MFKDLKPIYEKKQFFDGRLSQRLAILEDAGFGWIVVGYRNGRERMPQGILQNSTNCVEIPYRSRDGCVALAQVEYTEEELTVWKEEHQRAVLKFIREPVLVRVVL